MDDSISRQAVLAMLDDIEDEVMDGEGYQYGKWSEYVEHLPAAQPEIIRCNSCKYWTQSTGGMKGYGLGRCDFHDADLVACNGFCYWAERRTDARSNQQTGGD